MPTIYCFFQLPEHVEQVWTKNVQFWKEKKSKILNEYLSESGLYRTMTIKHGISAHIYGTSMGEKYRLRFAYLPDDNLTQVEIEIKFSYMGRGYVWKVPKDMITDWAFQMDLPQVEFYTKKKSLQQRNEFEKISDIIENKGIISKRVYCPHCGFANTYKTLYCKDCGLDLRLKKK